MAKTIEAVIGEHLPGCHEAGNDKLVATLIAERNELAITVERLSDTLKELTLRTKFYLFDPETEIAECVVCHGHSRMDGQPFTHRAACPVGAAEVVAKSRFGK